MLMVLPNEFNPYQLCEKAPKDGIEVDTQVPLHDLDNLASSLRSQDALVHVRLTFKKDENSFYSIQGTLEVTLHFECQRCLQPLEQTLQSVIKVSPVSSDEAAKKLSEGFEPLFTQENMVHLKDWLAEEVNLALPIVPRHTDCVVITDTIEYKQV